VKKGQRKGSFRNTWGGRKEGRQKPIRRKKTGLATVRERKWTEMEEEVWERGKNSQTNLAENWSNEMES
jgi:hypothetical protein